MKRKPLSKRSRFEIFTRDGFTCRYCGRQSDVVVLHVDHLIPVCQGGTNDFENLITACADCNLGKAGNTISQSAPTEADRLRMAQEMQEQIEAGNRARASAVARKRRFQDMINFWCNQTGRDEVDTRSAKTVFHYVQEYGEEVVYGWIDKASFCSDDKNMGKYISGIRRIVFCEPKQEAENAD